MSLQRDTHVLILSTGRRYRLLADLALEGADLPGVELPAGARFAAAVTVNPAEPDVLGLTNLCATAWTATAPAPAPVTSPATAPEGRDTMTVAPGHSIRLRAGLEIRFGAVSGKVELASVQSSLPVSAGWLLRVLSGPCVGVELVIDSGKSRGKARTLGRAAAADLHVDDAALAPEHVELEAHSDHVVLRALPPASLPVVAGAPAAGVRLSAGDRFFLGPVEFVVANPALGEEATRTISGGRRPRTWVRVGAASVVVTTALLGLLVAHGSVRIVPVTLLAMAAVAPLTASTYLLETRDFDGISYRTLGGTFLLGGSLGIVWTVLGSNLIAAAGASWLSCAVLAGIIEEPAKLLATAWRWRHPFYDRPVHGLILGTMSGFGFAVSESAGFAYEALTRDGPIQMVAVQALRAVLAPFGHGIWSGIVCASFWQCGRSPGAALPDPRFLGTLGAAVLLHGMWNTASTAGWIGPLASATLSVTFYIQLLRVRGHAV